MATQAQDSGVTMRLRDTIAGAVETAGGVASIMKNAAIAAEVERRVVAWLKANYPIPSVWPASRVVTMYRELALEAQRAADENHSGEIVIRARVHAGELVEMRLQFDRRIS